MIEVRHDLELPSVQDANPDAVAILADHMASIVDGDLPAVGIHSSNPGEGTHYDAHMRHQDLVLGAVAALGSSVLAEREFLNTQQRFVGKDQGPHTDLNHHTGPGKRSLGLVLRLHTANLTQTAQTIFAHTAPGAFADWNVNNSDDIAYVAEELGKIHQAKSINGALTGSLIYHFKQGPESSVLFKTRSSLGPVALHDFVSDDKSGTRHVYTAQLSLSAH